MADLRPVYLLTGSDRPKIETALQRLRRHFDPASVEIVSALDTPGDAVAALCNAGSLFGDSRLVVVEAVDGRRTTEGRLTGGWKAADVDAVAAYLRSPAPASVLALVAEDAKRDGALAKACAKAGDVLQYDVARKNLTSWVGERFAQRGVRAEREACAALVELVGEDLHALASEIEKVATWAAGEPVGEREIEQLVAPGREIPVFELTDAWSRRETGRVLEISERILDREGRRRDTVPRLAAALGSHVGKVKTAKRLASDGVRAADALAQLGTRSRFYADKLYQQADAFSDEELRDATVRLARLDLALKGDSKLAPDLELQRALADVSAPPATRPRR